MSKVSRALLFRAAGSEKNDAVDLVVGVTGRPGVLNSLNFEPSGSEFADEELLRYAVAAAVLGNALRNSGALLGCFVDDGQTATGFERLEKARVDFCGLCQVMINEAHEN